MFKNICGAQKLFMLMIVGLFILSVSSMVAGCGNKGDLYLPDKGSKNDTKPRTITSKVDKKG
jgi:predicted small lipoprotein YifL